jgi:hypothetical protein
MAKEGNLSHFSQSSSLLPFNYTIYIVQKFTKLKTFLITKLSERLVSVSDWASSNLLNFLCLVCDIFIFC